MTGTTEQREMIVFQRQDSEEDPPDFGRRSTEGTDNEESIEQPVRNRNVSNTKFYWIVGVLSAVIAILLAVIVVILVLSKGGPGFNTCLTKQCIGLAAMMKNYQNTSIDPCEDFYEHTCGLMYEHTREDISFGHARNRELPYRVFNILRNTKKFASKPNEQMRIFLNQCMNITGMNNDSLKDLREDIEMRGGFPFIDENWDESKFDLSAMLANYIKINRLRLPFIAVEPFMKTVGNTSMSRLFVGPGPHHSFYSNMALGVYKESVAELIRRLLKLENRKLDEAEFEKVFKELVAIENEIQGLAKPWDVRGSSGNVNQLKTLTDLQSQIPEVDWFKIIKAMAHDGISEEDEKKFLENVQVHNSDYYFGEERNLSAIINKASSKSLANYIVFRQLVDLSMYFYHKDQPQQKKYLNHDSLTAYCQYQIASFFPMPATNVLTEKSEYNFDNWKVGAEMFANIKKEYFELFDGNTYLEPSIRRVFRRKLEKMTGQFGDDLYLDGSPLLEKMYETLNFEENDTPFQVYMKLWRHRTEQLVEHVVHNTPLNPVHMHHFHLYGAYRPYSNNFFMNTAYLIYPWIDTNFPSFSNYGYVGFAIGHEIGHAFDSRHRKVNENGNVHNMWNTRTNSSDREFEKREKCLIDQYSSYKEPGHDFFMNGYLTRIELVSDHLGIPTAFRAFQKVKNTLKLPGFEDVSDDQMFFYNYALRQCGTSSSPKSRESLYRRNHATPRFRINGVLKNSPEFAETFKCPPKATMNPENKCKLY